MLQINSLAPDFSLGAIDALGNDMQAILSQVQTRLLVVYFYPKDNTSGCTQQACDFRSQIKNLQNLDTTIWGISPDNIKSHIKFQQKYDLPFSLLSDPDHTACYAYQCWVEKSMYGRKYFGVERSTFLIDIKKLTILALWRKVKVKDHVQEVVETIQNSL